MNLAHTDITTSAQKHRANNHYGSDREIWTKSVPWLELDERYIDPDDAPSPCPKSVRHIERVLDAVYIRRQGVAIVIPSPGISKEVNTKAAKVWRRHGFELRTWRNCEEITEGYIYEWVRMCDLPVNYEGQSRRYSAKAWLAWANREYKRLYLGESNSG